MRPRTSEELFDLVDDELQWRRTELVALLDLLSSSDEETDGKPRHRALARSGLLLAYAHWEGFVKASCQFYVNYVANKKIAYSDLNRDIARFAVSLLAKRARDDGGLDALTELVVAVAPSRSVIPKRLLVNQTENVRFSVLEGYFSALGLKVQGLETRRNFFDRELCDRRNEIAHGKHTFPAAADVAALIDSVIDMMDIVRTEIQNAAATESYRLAGIDG